MPFSWWGVRSVVVPGPDPIRLIARLVVPPAVDAIDLNELLADLDVDEILRHVDVDSLLARIDLDALLGQVDVNLLVDRVDVDALLKRVDVESLVERLNITEIVHRVQVDAIVRATAGGLGNRLLDLARRQLVGLDIILTRAVDKVLRRGVKEPVSEDGSFTGQLAGGASRLAAFLIDLAIESALFTTVVAATAFMASLFSGRDVKITHGGEVWHIVAYVALAGLYQWVSLIIAGRTFGRALAGLRVTAPDRSPLSVPAATRRVVVYPFSFILGLGLIGIVVGRRHRALHDIAAPSLVRYDWGDRPAAMPAPLTRFLQRQGIELDPDQPPTG